MRGVELLFSSLNDAGFAGDYGKAAEAYVSAKKWAEDKDVSEKVDVLLRNVLAKLAGNLNTPQ